MRLLQRSACVVRIAPRRTREDGMGGIVEEFSDEYLRLQCSVGYVNNSLNSSANALAWGEGGVRAAQTLRLRFIGEAGINVGDGALLPDDMRPAWRCVEVDRFPLMTLARLERIAAAGDGV